MNFVFDNFLSIVYKKQEQAFFSLVIGRITIFDALEAIESKDLAIYEGVIKVYILKATFDLFSFIIVRIR